MLVLLINLAASCIPKVPHTPTGEFDLFHAYCGQLWTIKYPDFDENTLKSEWKVKLTNSRIPKDTMLFPIKDTGRKVIYDRIKNERKSKLDPIIVQYEARSQSDECNADVRVSLFKETPTIDKENHPLVTFGLVQVGNQTEVRAEMKSVETIVSEAVFTYHVTHLYTFIYYPDTSVVEIMFDAKNIIKGSISELLGVNQLPFDPSEVTSVGFDIPETTCDIGVNNIYYGSSLAALYQWNGENYNVKKGAVTPPPPPKSIKEAYMRLLKIDPITTIFLSVVCTFVPLYTLIYLPFISKEGRELSIRAEAKESEKEAQAQNKKLD